MSCLVMDAELLAAFGFRFFHSTGHEKAFLIPTAYFSLEKRARAFLNLLRDVGRG